MFFLRNRNFVVSLGFYDGKMKQIMSQSMPQKYHSRLKIKKKRQTLKNLTLSGKEKIV